MGCTTGRCSPQVPQYITVRNIIFDGTSGTDGGHGVVGDSIALSGGTFDEMHTGSHHITFDGIEVRNGQGHGLQLLGDYGQCFNCKVHNTYENLEVYGNGTFSGTVGAGIWIACGARTVIKNVHAHNNQQTGVLLNSSEANTTGTGSSRNGSGGSGTGLSATSQNWAGSMPSGDSVSILQPNNTWANYHDWEPGDPQFGGQAHAIGGSYGLVHTGNTGE
jgi:hypothetical protein